MNSEISDLRATPEEMDKTMAMVDAMRNAGIRFVPVISVTESYHETMLQIMQESLSLILEIMEGQATIKKMQVIGDDCYDRNQ